MKTTVILAAAHEERIEDAFLRLAMRQKQPSPFKFHTPIREGAKKAIERLKQREILFRKFEL